MLSLITEFVLRLAYWRKPTSFSAPSKAHSSQLLLPHSHPRRLSESSCTETTCSFSTVCITLPQKRDKVNRNSSCLIRFLQKSLRLSCHLFLPHHLKPNEERLIEYMQRLCKGRLAEQAGYSTVCPPSEGLLIAYYGSKPQNCDCVMIEASTEQTHIKGHRTDTLLCRWCKTAASTHLGQTLWPAPSR